MTISLGSMALFAELPLEAHAEVLAALHPRNYPAGTVIFNQGDPGDELLIVEAGEIAIFAPTTGPAIGQAIRIFKPGDVLGEMALIDQQPRSLSARAESDAAVLTLGKADFRRLVAGNPELGLAVMRGLSERIRYTTDFLTQVRTWVQRVAAGNFQPGDINTTPARDSTLASLAADFARMAAEVQRREDELKREVAQLRIEIDETRRQQDVARITQSEEFVSMREQARRMREELRGG
jgi:CRP-like cAMP-binding protein